MPQACRIVLPIPPSANKATRNLSDKEKLRLRSLGKGVPPRVATKEMRQWREQAGWILQTQKRQQFAGPFRVRILMSEDERMDVDNVQKQTVDLLVKHRITPDDRFAKAIGSERDPDVKRGEIVVIVESAK